MTCFLHEYDSVNARVGLRQGHVEQNSRKSRGEATPKTNVLGSCAADALRQTICQAHTNL